MHLLPESVFDQHVIVLGKTRSGKSSAMRFLVEHLLDAEKPVCIIDPKGDWYGLKSSADGKHAGYPIVIFGGEHGDLPLNARAGHAVAELVVTGDRSCIIDLGGWMPGDRTQFWIDFASTYFRMHRGRHWLVIDEVHNLCPKGKIIDPNAGKMLHWSNRLASEGLGKGISLLAASQRPQKVHNDFLTSCETLLGMRVIHKADRDAIKDWIDGCGDPEKGKDMLTSIASMKRGEAWAWSPEAEFGPKRIQFPMFKTYDSFKPQAGGAPAKLKGWADVDLEEIRAKLTVVIKESEANDPAKLKARIRELELEARKAPEARKEVRVEDSSRVAELTERLRVAITYSHDLKAHVKKMEDILGRLAYAHERNSGVVNGILESGNALEQSKPVNVPTIPPAAPAKRILVPHRPPTTTSTSQTLAVEVRPLEVKLRPGATRMLSAAAMYYPSGITEGQMAAQAGVKRAGGSFSSYKSNLKTNGLLSQNGDLYFATAAGMAYLGETPASPASTEEVLSVWMPKLRPGAQRMLRVLIESHGDTITHEELAQLSGVSTAGGSFSSYLSNLRTAGLAVNGPGRGTVCANRETLFL